VSYLLACLAFVVVRDRSLFLSTIAIFAVGLLAMRVHRVAGRELRVDVTTSRQRWTVIGAVAAFGVALLLAWRLGVWVDGAGFFGVAVLYVAIGVGLQELRRWEEPPVRAFLAVLAASAGITVVAVVAMALGLEGALPVAVVFGVVGTPIGLSLVSELAERRLRAWTIRSWLALTAGGGVVLVAAMAVLRWQGAGLTYVLVFSGAVLLLMLGIAARSTVDVVLVVAASAVVWALSHQSVPLPRALQPGVDDEVVVALGDSFISGEGAEEFFEGTNHPGVNSCRRAPTAYPVLLLQERRLELPDRLLFNACSGAKAHEVAGEAGSQVEALRQDGYVDDDIAFVLLSVAGNDALFGTVAQACLAPVDCTRLAPALTAHLHDVGRTLATLYARLETDLADRPVVVVPYPLALRDRGCDWSAFSHREHRFLHDFTMGLNAVVTERARAAGFEVVDTMPEALARSALRLCDGAASDAGVNFLAANSVFGTLEQSVNPTNWIHNSLHPNARGHEAMRAALVEWLVANPDRVRPSEAVRVPVPDEAAIFPQGPPCVGASDLEACANDWLVRELARFLLVHGLTGVVLLATAWVLAIQLLRPWRALFGDEFPVAPTSQP
jgi:hypothetical protein